MSARHHRSSRSRTRFRSPRFDRMHNESFCRVLLPPFGVDPIILTDVADAASMVFELFEVPFHDAAVVMLDERRVVTAILLDPPPDVDLILSWHGAAADVIPCCQIVVVVVKDEIVEAPVSEEDEAFFRALQRAALEHGVLLMDVFFANPHKLQSLAIVCDPHCIWNDELDDAS